MMNSRGSPVLFRCTGNSMWIWTIPDPFATLGRQKREEERNIELRSRRLKHLSTSSKNEGVWMDKRHP